MRTENVFVVQIHLKMTNNIENITENTIQTKTKHLLKQIPIQEFKKLKKIKIYFYIKNLHKLIKLQNSKLQVFRKKIKKLVFVCLISITVQF